MSSAPQGDPGTSGAQARIVKATTVAVGDSAVLILGPSGAGKSSLALQLIALGAVLVADDGTELHEEVSGELIASPPEATRGLIEARGVGLLRVPVRDRAVVRLVVDLDLAETDRLPPHRTAEVLGQSLPLLRRAESPHFASAVLLHLAHGRDA